MSVGIATSARSVSIRDESAYERISPIYRQLGSVSPDDCSLALRGLQSMVVRLAHMERSALELAGGSPNIRPWRCLSSGVALMSRAQFWKRDFKGSASVFDSVSR